MDYAELEYDEGYFNGTNVNILKFSKAVLISVLLPVQVLFAQSEWTTLSIPDATRYDDVFFINANVGWTAGGYARKVHKTTDGGVTWNEVGGLFPYYLRSIHFLDENIGFCGSLNGGLYRTTDGGTTWTDVAPGITPQPAGICGLAGADQNTIYGVGIWSEPAFVVKSVDKGINWTYIDMAEYANSLIDAKFFDADHGFVAGSVNEEVEGEIYTRGIVLYTENGGATWTEKIRTTGVSDRIWKLQTPDNIHIFGAVESLVPGEPTRIIKSSDAGQTWDVVTVDPDYYYCQAVGFIDAMRGWTGGSRSGVTALFETTDGGEHWSMVDVGSTYNRFFKVTDNVAYLTGRKVYKFNRKVVTGTIDKEPYDPVHSLTVSPNPAQSAATVKVKFGNPTRAQVYVYDMQGKTLSRIFEGMVEEEEKVFKIDVQSISSQTIIIILKTNEGMDMVKLLKK